MKGLCQQYEVCLPDTKTGGRIVPFGREARSILSTTPRELDNPRDFAGRFPGRDVPDRRLNALPPNIAGRPSSVT